MEFNKFDLKIGVNTNGIKQIGESITEINSKI